MPWLVRSVRITSFLTPNAVVPPNIWNSVVGGEPENVAEQRLAGVRLESGRFLDSTAALQFQPGRIDWLFTPTPSLESQPPTLGQFPEAVDQFLQPISAWLTSESFPPATRLALGIVLMEPTATRETGYERLRAFINTVPQGNATDFLYQINRYRPSQSGIPGLILNRVSKWSVAEFHTMVFDQRGPVIGPAAVNVNVELDVNTAADRTDPIPRGSLGAVLNDLRSGAIEVATDGDRLN